MTHTMSIQSRNGRDRDEAYHIVRRFSQCIGDEYPHNNLAQALAVTEEYEQTRAQYVDEESRAEALLIVEDSESSWVVRVVNAVSVES